MKTTVALLTAVLLLAGGTAHAGDGATRGRGWLTGVGLGLTALGGLGIGLGVAGAINAGETNSVLSAYVGNGRAPTSDEAATVKSLQARAGGAQTQAVVGFVLGALALAGSITCIVLDGLETTQPLAVGFAPAPGGGAVLFAGRF